MESEQIALVDMDGTLADYTSALNLAMLFISGPDEPGFLINKDPHLKARRQMIKSQPGFWRNLNKIESGFRVLEILKDVGFSIHILTKGPVKTTSAWTEKVEWCAEHVPDTPITITQDKGLIYGKVLFDDYPDYMTRWLKWRPRGFGIMLDQPWNQGFEHPNVFRYKGKDSDNELIDKLLPIFTRSGVLENV